MTLCGQSELPESMKEQLILLMRNRAEALV